MFKYLGADDFRAVLEIDLSHDQRVLWIRTICGNKVDCDSPDPKAIDLSPAHEETEYVSRNKKEEVKDPQTALVNAKLPPYDAVDLVKINAGIWTPYILETIKEVIDVNKPFVFITVSDKTDDDSIHTLLIEQYGYQAPEVTIANKVITLVYHHDDASILEEFN